MGFTSALPSGSGKRDAAPFVGSGAASGSHILHSRRLCMVGMALGVACHPKRHALQIHSVWECKFAAAASCTAGNERRCKRIAYLT